MVGAACHTEDGRVTVAWNMQVAKIAEDGSPTQIIIPGPTSDHKGCAIHLYLVTHDGAEVTDDARVVLEASSPDEIDVQMMFDGDYGQFRAAPDHTVGALKRGVVKNDCLIRLAVTLPASSPELDLDESTFEIKCFKHLMTLSA